MRVDFYSPYFAVEFLNTMKAGVVYVVYDDKKQYKRTVVGFHGQIIGAEEDVKYERYVQAIDTVEELRKEYKRLKVPYTDVEQKRKMREFVRNNLPVFAVQHENQTKLFGVMTTDADRVSGYMFTPDVGFSKYQSTFGRDCFQKNVVRLLGFENNKGWYHK